MEGYSVQKRGDRQFAVYRDEVLCATIEIEWRPMWYGKDEPRYAQAYFTWHDRLMWNFNARDFVQL